MKDVFGYEPRVFENTEFIYHNSIGRTLEKMGFIGVFTEGAERILGSRSTSYLYRSEGSELAVIMRDFRLSDDIAFRFSAVEWPGHPLTADKYASWLASTWGDVVTVFIDYETFGEHQWPETGILDFLEWLPGSMLEHGNIRFLTASEAIADHDPVGTISIDDFDATSWADVERTTNAWLGNDMQRTCYRALRDLEPFVKKTGNEDILRLWRYLQISDHLYYMYTQPGASGLVHGYFSSQPPVKAFWIFSRILSDLYLRTSRRLRKPGKDSCRLLRLIPPDRAFHFYIEDQYIDLSAHSLGELRDVVMMAPQESLVYHGNRGDFEKWVRFTVGDGILADRMREIGGHRLREELLSQFDERLAELESWNH
jgi:alpha-amylase